MRKSRTTRRGFTLVELVLASVIGSLVLLGALAVFRLIETSDRSMQARFESTQETAIAHQAIQRSLMRLVLADEDSVSLTERSPEEALDEDQAEQAADDATSRNSGDDAAASDEPDADEDDDDFELLNDQDRIERPRLVLEREWSETMARMAQAARIDGVNLLDPSLGLGFPQRLEVVLIETPLPPGFEVGRPSWLPRRTNEVAENIALFANASAGREGGVRGVFELRPDGARELILAGMGLSSRTLLRAEGVKIPREARDPKGWTLWWRPVTETEYVVRESGRVFDPDSNPEYLAQAIPLLRGVTVARWDVIADRAVEGSDRRVLERYSEYRALSETDVPGYVELEVETASGVFHSWAFEIGWVVDAAFSPSTGVIEAISEQLELSGEELPNVDTDGDGINDAIASSDATGLGQSSRPQTSSVTGGRPGESVEGFERDTTRRRDPP
ncbi:MAG: prepilin-type N-terminal cleavage/methylation domain-containing protein [Planctomycetota bacterium]